jgi:chloramphenicol 3-O-phosphotransferase
MAKPFVILTGASGVGKSTIAQTIEDMHPEIAVYQGDRMGLPSEEILASYGHTDEPGGPIQRGFALYWLGKIAQILKTESVLLETQCRIAFLHEALSVHGITHARILLLECSDPIRSTRLHERGQPELANEQMSGWSRFLHREAEKFGHEILDTSALPLDAITAHIVSYFN